MKRWAVFITIVLLVGLALIPSQRQKIAAPVGPQALLFFVADTQRELTRLPVAFTRLSDEEEISIGNELAKRYAGAGPLAKKDRTTGDVQAYVDRVGAHVAGRAHRKLPYKFHYVADPGFVNAFALPGGHVFIGGGLIALMDSEDELASVLGHEVEHIDHYHCAERIQTEQTLRNLPLGEVVGIPVEIFEAGYSKEQELEADREGIRLAVMAAGYSPLGAVRMFQAFDRLYQRRDSQAQTPQDELSQIAQQTLEGYFRSHPLPSERIAQVQKMMSEQHWENMTSERTLEVAYVFWTERAREVLAAKKYAAAENAAAHSLELHPDQPEALAVLAEAQFAQEKFSRAGENYRKLVGASPAVAGAVAEFANGIAAQALVSGHYDQAVKFGNGSLELQTNNAKALTILAEAQLSLADFTAAAATYRKLKTLYPDAADTVIGYTSSFAARTLAAHRYEQAASVSSFWLTLQPHQNEALTILAEADLAAGKFSASAKACRNLLDLTPKDQYLDMNLVWSYADALRVADAPPAAAKEFANFMKQSRLSTPALDAQIKIEWAGLMLMAGNGTPAQELIGGVKGDADGGVAPELLVRLGWWYYRAGNYRGAEALLRSIAAQRPGDANLQNDLGWVELEQNKVDDAIERFTRATPGMQFRSNQWNTQAMGLAVGLWNSHRTEDALKNFESAAAAEPRWLNERLVRAFYSPRVTQTVAEMQAERAKRLEAKLRKP